MDIKEILKHVDHTLLIKVGYPWNAKMIGLSFVKIASYSASVNP